MKKLVLILSFAFTIIGFSQKNNFSVNWIIPKALSNPLIMSYERMEFGVDLPDSLDAMILNFIKDSTTANRLNPFDPEDIDIKAQFYIKKGESWQAKQFVYAFYFEDFKRNTSAKNPKEWNWIKQKTKDNFRVRFAPTEAGKWKFALTAKIKNKNILTIGEYEFSCENSGNPGYVKVSENKRYLKLGENVFIPVGQNMPKPLCYYVKDEKGNVVNDEYKCVTCECAGYEEWCPGMKPWPINPNAYMTYLKEIEKLRNAGANYYRVMIYPHTYEFEYDKLGNYYARLNSAWELDQLIDKSNEIGIKLNLDIFAGYAAAVEPYGIKGWDWVKENEGDYGYCYRRELGLNETIDFLTDADALKHYKNRLRYIVSRWGYSTAIAQLEMMNEINNKFQKYPKEMYKWHYEVTKYLKEDLGSAHLISVNYDGTTPEEDKGDLSFSIPYVDVITHNFHRIGISRKDALEAWNKFSYHNKPLIFSEIGTGDSGLEHCDYQTEWRKDLWLTLFSGTASAGVNWNEQHNYKLWEDFKNLQEYIKDINFEEYGNPSSKIRKDGLAEVVYLQSASKDKSIGAIQNLSWNYATNSNGGKCTGEFKPSEELYLTFQAVSAKKKRKGVFLIEMKGKTTYVIEWFDPMTGKTIRTDETVSKSSGKLFFAHPDLDKNMPFVCYKIYPKGEKFSTMKPFATQMKAGKKEQEKKVYTE